MDEKSQEENDTDDETVKTYSKNKAQNSVFSRSISSASSESSQSLSENEDYSSDSDVDIGYRRSSKSIISSASTVKASNVTATKITKDLIHKILMKDTLPRNWG